MVLETFRMLPDRGTHIHGVGREKVELHPGDEITCERWELKGAMDKFKCVQPATQVPPQAQPTVGLKLVHRGGQWYDVINEATGKPINDKALRKEDAEQLVADQAETDAQLECAGCGASISEGDPRCKDEPTCKDCADELEESRAKGADEE